MTSIQSRIPSVVLWLLTFAALGILLTAPVGAKDDSASTTETVAVFHTNHGDLVFRFFPAKAPQTVAQIQNLIRAGWYDGKEFYRVVSGHVIQAGDVDGESAPKVAGEFGAYPHVRGAVGLARDADPDSGTTEIYICHAPRPHLDGKYAVFGLLVEGFDVLDAIAATPVKEEWVGDEGKVAFHRPLEPVVIVSARLAERKPAPADS
jgi:cyclophilin family peptidyl-prolyl cis-trans isomerase